MKSHYDKKYYDWQKEVGKIEPLYDSWKFKKYIKDSDIVLDFGCGGGFMLGNLSCKKRYGVEINESAALQARENGLECYADILAIPNKVKFDVVISNHALEHTECPLEEIKKLKSYLHKDSIVVFILPFDDWRREKRKMILPKPDINMHLYTWSPKLICNLFYTAGYKVLETEVITNAWYPKISLIGKFVPEHINNMLCYLWSFFTNLRQVKIVAKVK